LTPAAADAAAAYVLRNGLPPPHQNPPYLCVVVHAVCVGEDAPPRDHEAAAVAAVLPLALPRQAEVGLRVDAEHLQHISYLLHMLRHVTHLLTHLLLIKVHKNFHVTLNLGSMWMHNTCRATFGFSLKCATHLDGRQRKANNASVS
jgi:hypothetical protein